MKVQLWSYTRRDSAIPCTVILLIALIIVNMPETHAQSVFDRVTECDMLASHPADVTRVAPGVNPEELVPSLAIDACEDALRQDSGNPRLSLQLGRAYLQADDTDQAYKYFEQAAKAGSGVAYVYLGDAAQFGWNGGADISEAITLYKQALQQGVDGAQAVIDQLTFSPADFSVGLFLEHLVESRVADAADIANDARARAYLFTFALELQTTCGNILEPDSVSAMYLMRYPPDWDAVQEQQDVSINVQDFVASYDAARFVSRHNCEGQITEKLSATMNKVFHLVNSNRQ